MRIKSFHFSIHSKEAFPYYMVDYQERPETSSETRWIDRVIPDGTWSGNLYEFYQKTIRKLTADLKVPFELHAETRIEDTPVHRALREALTNTLIHADYTGRISILIVKRPDLFAFRNPGLMRVSIEQAKSGGVSDCRNHRIQDMFRYIGLGEHAGSGIPGILRSWESQHWRKPILSEDQEYEQTSLILRTSSLLPEESIEALQTKFGDEFSKLTELQRIILVTAHSEGIVSHSRIRDLCTEHPKDISSALSFLVKEEMLEKKGSTRDAVYYISGEEVRARFNSLLSEMERIFARLDQSYPTIGKNILDLNKYIPDIGKSIPDIGKGIPDIGKVIPDIGKVIPDLSKSFPDLGKSFPDLNDVLVEKLESMGYEKMPGKLAAEKMRELIITLCSYRWITIKELSELLQRESASLQEQYLTSMVGEGILELKHPVVRNHPDQAYKTKHK